MVISISHKCNADDTNTKIKTGAIDMYLTLEQQQVQNLQNMRPTLAKLSVGKDWVIT